MVAPIGSSQPRLPLDSTASQPASAPPAPSANDGLHALYARLPSTLSPATLAFVRAQTPVGDGPIQVLDVDSSWGAGPDGSEHGGARTDTWMYNTRTKEWADFDAETGAFRTSKVGPQDERPTGSYRPQGAA